MVTIKVCVGSSCHLKGSYGVIEAFKEILKKYGVEDLVDLQASFCLGHCSKGVTVKAEGLSSMPEPCDEITIDNAGLFLHNCNADNADEKFDKYIYSHIQC